MTPFSKLRASKLTPHGWKHLALVECGADSDFYSVRHAATFNLVGAGLRRLARLGTMNTEQTNLKEALMAGAALEKWLEENKGRK